MRLRALVLVGALAAVAVLGGCGSDGAAKSEGTFNDADVTFAQGMIPHHQQAIEMADMALDPVSEASPQTRRLAARIKEAQGPEIAQMGVWLDQWDMSSMMDHSQHGMEMEGMMSTQDMQDLSSLRARMFDAEFARMMIAHHEGALAMAATVQSEGLNPDVRAMAGRVIAGQTEEIKEMRASLR